MKHRTTMLRRAARRAGFTDREIEILTLLVEEEMSAGQAARRIGISPNTARGHLYSARQRKGVRSNEALIAALAWDDRTQLT